MTVLKDTGELWYPKGIAGPTKVLREYSGFGYVAAFVREGIGLGPGEPYPQ